MPVMVTTCHRGDEPDATPLSFLAPGPGFAHCFAGSGFQADELLASLRALGPVNDTITSVPMSAISHLHMDPEHPVPYAGEGLLLADLPAAAVNTLTEVAGPGAAFPLPKVEVRHLGGELARPWPGHGALASLDAQYLLHAVGAASGPDAGAAVQGQATAITTALAPWAAPTMYLNFAETPSPAAPLWTQDACHRLRRIKAKVDPGDIIRSSHPSARQRDRPCRPGCAHSRRSGVVDRWYRLPVRACRCGGSGCLVFRCRRWEILRRYRAALGLLRWSHGVARVLGGQGRAGGVGAAGPARRLRCSLA